MSLMVTIEAVKKNFLEHIINIETAIKPLK
jgi:hypothetical protein